MPGGEYITITADGYAAVSEGARSSLEKCPGGGNEESGTCHSDCHTYVINCHLNTTLFT